MHADEVHAHEAYAREVHVHEMHARDTTPIAEMGKPSGQI